jgi:hypothetical protein
MLKLPYPTTDDIKLADWLELLALTAPDSNSSYSDLERALRREGVSESPNNGDLEQLLQAVASEIQLRSSAAGAAYPFEVEQRSIALREPIEKFVPYVFCLCISYLDGDRLLDQHPFPRRMFERLSSEAAKSYVGGDAVRFASPRVKSEIPEDFPEAVNELCKRIGEGQGFRLKRLHSEKDDAIDIVAWRDFPDMDEGKLLLFGNCATGTNWDGKLDELQPDIFCEEWMNEVPVSVKVSIRALFVPRRLDKSRWKKVSRRSGVIFDRCRLAYWTQSSFPARQDMAKWTTNVLNRLAAS